MYNPSIDTHIVVCIRIIYNSQVITLMNLSINDKAVT